MQLTTQATFPRAGFGAGTSRVSSRVKDPQRGPRPQAETLQADAPTCLQCSTKRRNALPLSPEGDSPRA
jgi:hypothetical protein